MSLIETILKLDKNKIYQNEAFELNLSGSTNVFGHINFIDEQSLRVLHNVTEGYVLTSDSQGYISLQPSIGELSNGILEFNDQLSRYEPYSALTEQSLYLGSDLPTGTTRLNYDGYFNASNIKTIDNNTKIGINTDGDGLFQTKTGFYSGFLVDSDGVTLYGSFSGRESVGDDSSYFGKSSGYLSTGHTNLGLGVDTLRDNNANNVVGIGYGAGSGNTLNNKFFLQQKNVSAIPLIEGDFLTGDVTLQTLYLHEPETDSGLTYILGWDGGKVKKVESAQIFTEDIIVSIEEGKTFGRYENGDTILAIGKTPAEVIKMALNEPLAPTLTLTSSGNDVAFGEANKVVYLSYSYVIETLNGVVDTVQLQWRRNNTGSWVTLTTNTTTPNTFTHNIDDSGDRFNTTQINYRYIVTDNFGGSETILHNVTPQSYLAPTISLLLNGTLDGIDETQNSREKGNVVSAPSGSITSQRSLVNITTWTLERRYDGGAWTVLASDGALNIQSVIIPSTSDTVIPTNVTSIDYKITYTDEFTTGDATQSIEFFYYSYYGYNSNTSLNGTQIQALNFKEKLNNQLLTWSSITATQGNYTYYSFPSTYTNVTLIERLTPAPPETTAWDNLSNVLVTNTYGESLNYRVWRTNATEAYTDVGLKFS